MPEHIFNKLSDFLLTYSPREEKIIRFKFGLACARKTDKELIDMFRHYMKSFNAAQLRRHYEFIEKSVFSSERKNYGVFFIFKSNTVYITNPIIKEQWNALTAIGEIYTQDKESF